MTIPRIVVVGEGPADLQVIPVLLKRLLEQSGCQVGKFDTYPMKSFRDVTSFEKKVHLILNREPHDLVVIVVDQDNDPTRLDALREGRTRAGDPYRCAIGLAVKMLEAWLLADPKAWKAVFPRVKKIPLPPKPEECWGKKESDRYPKRQLQTAFEACNVGDAQEVAAYRLQLAQAIDLAHLARVCPEGFGALADEIKIRWLTA